MNNWNTYVTLNIDKPWAAGYNENLSIQNLDMLQVLWLTMISLFAKDVSLYDKAFYESHWRGPFC